MAGRAARNVKGKVIFYADKITRSMQRTMEETDRRRDKQIKHNMLHGIVPTTVKKSVEQIMKQTSVLEIKSYDESKAYDYTMEAQPSKAAEPVVEYRNVAFLDKEIAKAKKEMEKAAKDLDFMEAARLRDLMFSLQKEREDLLKD